MQLLGLTLAQLAGLLTALSAVTVAMYLLKLRRRRVEVPFLPLWESLLLDKQSSQLFLRLRHLLSLLLSLLIVWLLAFALADPRPSAALRGTAHRLILIDAGLTMQATDVVGGRLEHAKERARTLTSGAGGGQLAMVAQLDGSVIPLSTMTDERVQLSKAVSAVRPSQLPSDYAAAYRFALDVLGGQPGAELVVLSDRANPPDDAQASALQRAGVDVRYEPFGARNDNVAITAFAVRRYPLDRNRSELLVGLHNASPHAERVELRLYGDGAEIDVQTLELPAGRSEQRIYGDITGVRSKLHARIVAADGHDDLAVDDEAFAVLPERRRMRVLCVTDGNRYLEAALLLDEYLEVDVTTPAAYRAADGYDAVVLDRFVPESAPSVPALFLEPKGTGAGAPLEVDGEMERPFFERTERKHPVLAFTALHDANVARALHVRTKPGDRVLAGDRRGPLIVTGERGGTAFVALTFDVRASDLPLRTAWPLLLLNTLDFLTRQDAAEDEPLELGQPAQIQLASPTGDVQAATVTQPGGAARAVATQAGAVTITPERAGFVQLAWQGGERVLAANLGTHSPRELTPRPAMTVRGKAAPRPSVTAQAPSQPPWAWLLLGALFILAIELATYHRRWTV